jgi:hypothetical protein
MADDPLVPWTVYNHPRDYPDTFIARRTDIGRDGIRVTNEVVTAPDVESLRDLFRAHGLTAIARDANDDPNIVEVWL